MLRNDLKQSLPENWRDLFKHRYCDPEDYEVAVFPSKEQSELPKTLVLNPNTLDIMDYFYDDVPNDYQISLVQVLNRLKPELDWSKSIYLITKDFNLFKSSNNKSRDIKNLKTDLRHQYPRLNLIHPDIKTRNKSFNISIHRIIANLFVPNPFPKKFNIVNHKDINSSNYEMENLEWCDTKYNNKSSNRNFSGKNIQIRQYNSNRELIACIESLKDYKNFGKEKWLNDNRLHNGFYWEKVDLTLEDYLSRHPIIDNGWYTNKFITSRKIEANLCGVLRIDGKLTVGSLDSKLNYTISISGVNKHILVHRLIFETISGKLIPANMVIDHISPVSKVDINNEYDNLKLCTQKENMNNPNTRNTCIISQNKSTILMCDLFGNIEKSFNSIHEYLVSYLKMDPELTYKSSEYMSIYRCLDGRSLVSFNHLWVRSNDISLLNLKKECIIHKYNDTGELISSGINMFDVVGDKNKSIYYSNKYLNTGRKAPDGFYYWQGSGFQIDNLNENLIKKKDRIYFNKLK